jgi:transposase
MLVLVYVGNECRDIAKHLLILEETVKRAVEKLKEEGK